MIELITADNRTLRTADEWQTEYFSQVDEKARMASMPDLYHAGKYGEAALIDSLRRDFFLNCILTSTRNQYSCSDEGYMTHGYGGKEAVRLYGRIPDFFDGKTLAYAAKMPETEKHMQKLFDTDDEINTIVGVIKRLSGYTADKTIIWTPDPENRKRGNFERVCGLQEFFNRFIIMENVQISQKGRTRVVRED